ncbi:XrtA/PEP-CTERM system-associated ATPase [Sphingobium sp. CCH11-B1]|jgi:putative secretion ATPase (PEP-CTERM system associated)|uniref:XrtA/PEP-CTERM system-associated ATPase n=1 Tax=Sphingobium sp. CCH11-B1 TaxID=1768781 RepID=UPI000836E95F|nr:XrtA/PEP-CTERM system-associated ATPase [Sphingobium sp. CCH11-B1]MEA3388937.1 XrtA/PEP-CTERM system-associated ATPase [Pseudomonadota bacterium]
MYDQFYGLRGRPFQLTPDPHYYFESATHRKALSYLGYGLAQGEGFIVITGDIGAGKTTLVGHLMQTIDPARLTAVKIVSTQVEGDDMLRLAAQSFGLATDGQNKAATLRQIESFLYAQARAGRRTLLIVDEAQNLPVSAIEELRMLSNFQLGGQSLLQIFLLGQPEFRDLIKSPELEQLRQRVIATHHLEPMMEREIEPYILHRLTVAGWTGTPTFTPGAFAALYAATAGVPRRLNALTSRVLLLGAIEQIAVLDEDVVAAVVADMGLDIDLTPAPTAASALDAVEDADAFPVQEAGAMEESTDHADVSVQDHADPADIAQDIAEDKEGGQPDHPVASNVVTPLFQRPAFAAPEAVWEPALKDEQEAEDAESHEHEAVHVAVSEEDDEAIEAVHVAVSEQDDASAAETVHIVVAEEAETLRSDMLAEIEGLRAEIASLRAMQSHAPFAQPVESQIDPEALKGCFTLIEERLAALEFRAEEQDSALRRVLTLLVDWVEQEGPHADAQAIA